MSKTDYLIIAIAVIVLLSVIFVVSYILYKRTPVPKGCEDIKVSEEKCKGCSNEACHYHQKEEE